LGGGDVLEGTAEAEDACEEPRAGILVSAEEGGREGADPPPPRSVIIPGRWVVRRGRALDCWRCRRRDSRDGGSTGGGVFCSPVVGLFAQTRPREDGNGFRLQVEQKFFPNHAFPVLCSLQGGVRFRQTGTGRKEGGGPKQPGDGSLVHLLMFPSKKGRRVNRPRGHCQGGQVRTDR